MYKKILSLLLTMTIIFSVANISVSAVSNEDNNITIHYYNENNWDNPYIYCYNNSGELSKWPGEKMTPGVNNWYSYVIRNYSEAKVIFSNKGANLYPAQYQEGISISGEKWFKNGSLYSKDPDNYKITVHYYNYNAWAEPYIYYYGDNTPVQWPGVAMTADGNGWYSYDIYGFDQARVLFSDKGSNQDPGQYQEGYIVSEEMWYNNGIWSNQPPNESNEIVVNFYKPNGWASPYIYYYSTETDTGPTWPGTAMTKVSDNWYTYTINKYSKARVLFNDKNQQIPDQNQPGFEASGTMWYKDGVWCDSYSDSDNDDLPDSTELVLGTDINNADTDGDGLPDGYEVKTLGSDPKLVDSNSNGVLDGEEDSDNDNLSNYFEYVNKTNPFNADTDGDGLNDYEEIYKYYTDPLKYDTDGDGLGDYTEIKAGLNPLSCDSNNDGINDSDETITQNVIVDKNDEFDIESAKVVPSITITGKGDYSQKISVKDISYNTDISNLYCIVGSPYEFEHNEDLSFDKCTLTFKLNKDIYADNNITDLCIAWYDEVNHTINPIKTCYDESEDIIYGDVEHFSTYLVINKKEFWSSILQDANPGMTQNTDVETSEYVQYNGHYYSVIDESMPWDEAMKYCASLGGHLVTIQSKEEQNFITGLIKNNPKKNTYWIGLTGEDNHYSWVTGEPLKYENWASGEPNNPKETVVHMYAKINSVSNVGEWNDTLNANDGGSGDYYSYKNCGLICEWDNNPEDYKAGIKLSTGECVKLKSDPSLTEITDDGVDPYSVDSDYDGIPDKTELTGISTFQMEFNGEVIEYEAWNYISNPALADTDGDGIKDKDDLHPTKFDVTVTIPDGGNESCLKLNTNKFFNAYYGDINEFLQRYYTRNFELFDFNVLQEYNRLLINDFNSFSVDEYVALGKVCIEAVKLRLRNENIETRHKVYQQLVGNENDIFQPVDYASSEEFWKLVKPDEALKKYFTTSVTQMLFGRYAEDNVNTLGTAGEIGLSIFGFDILQDLRDLSYDLNNYHWDWESNLNIAVDSIGLLPVIGVLKNSDEVLVILKRSDNVFESRKLPASVKFIVKNGVKYLGSTTESIYTSVAKNIDKFGNKLYSKVLGSLNKSSLYQLLYADTYSNKLVEGVAKNLDQANELCQESQTYFDNAMKQIGNKAGLETSNVNQEIKEIITNNKKLSVPFERVLSGVLTSVRKVRAENSLQCIGKIPVENMDYADDIVKNVAEELRQMIKDGIIREATGGKIRDSVVSVSVDKSNGKLYYGISGHENPTRRADDDTAQWLAKRLQEEKPAWEANKEIMGNEYVAYYYLDNCGEFNAVNTALKDGANYKNLWLYSLKIKKGSFVKPCNNCKHMYEGYMNFID